MFRMFYWIPYHVDFAKFTDNSNRGRQLSMFRVTRDIIAGLIPILSGYIISQQGYSFVFGIAIAWIAVFQGYDCVPTSEGISRATTRSVVYSSLAVLGIDFILTAMMLGGW